MQFVNRKYVTFCKILFTLGLLFGPYKALYGYLGVALWVNTEKAFKTCFLGK